MCVRIAHLDFPSFKDPLRNLPETTKHMKPQERTADKGARKTGKQLLRMPTRQSTAVERQTR